MTDYGYENKLAYKQQLIQKEVIDKNYDKTLFFNYCMTKKENGDDFYKWTISELSEIITQFKEDQDQKMSNPIHQIQTLQEEIKLDMEKLKEDKKLFSSMPSTYIKEYICIKIPRTVLNNIPLKVIIRDPQFTQSGYLSFNYITYEIQTTGIPFSVRRRFSDFEWLRSTLVKQYPMVFVPPVPTKQIGSKRFEKCFVLKRMKHLQQFLDELTENELFKASASVVAFLSEDNRKGFEKKMKEQSAIVTPSEIQSQSNLNGIIVTNIDNEENQIYQSNIENFFNEEKLLLDGLSSNMTALYQSIKDVEKNLSHIQKDFEGLQLLNAKVLMKNRIIRSYEELGVFFKTWKTILHNQNEIIASTINNFFEYIRMECSTYKELINGRKALRDLYALENTKLSNKKESQWSTMIIDQWEIADENQNNIDQGLLMKDKRYAFEKMNTLETKRVDNIYVELCYANRCVIDEVKRMITRYCFSYIDTIKKFTNEMYPSLNDALSIWSNLASFAEGF